MDKLTQEQYRAARLILELRRVGITDNDVLNAIETVSRAGFVNAELADLAYENCLLPTDCGQSVLSPEAAGRALQALALGGGVDRALVVGAGGGYVPALLGEFATEVVGVERYARLVEAARANLKALGADGIDIVQGDGFAGWPDRAPYDRILITGMVEAPPHALLAQLAPSGRLAAFIAAGEAASATVFDASGAVLATAEAPLAPALGAGVAEAL